MTPLQDAQREVRVQREHVRLLRTLLSESTEVLVRAENRARRIQLGSARPVTESARLDQLELGDRIHWAEFHEGPLTVTHLGKAGRGIIELGCDGWTADELLPVWELVQREVAS